MKKQPAKTKPPRSVRVWVARHNIHHRFAAMYAKKPRLIGDYWQAGGDGWSIPLTNTLGIKPGECRLARIVIDDE